MPRRIQKFTPAERMHIEILSNRNWKQTENKWSLKLCSKRQKNDLLCPWLHCPNHESWSWRTISWSIIRKIHHFHVQLYCAFQFNDITMCTTVDSRPCWIKKWPVERPQRTSNSSIEIWNSGTKCNIVFSLYATT